MTHEKELAAAILRYARDTDDHDALTRLSEMAWSLRPLIERPDSGVPEALGERLWLYVGLKRDANPEMAEKYARLIERDLETAAGQGRP